MIRRIAPGGWDPQRRQFAKFAAFVVGAVLLFWGLGAADRLLRVVEGGGEVTLLSAVLVLVPFVLGGAAIFPGIVTPIVYRVIDRLWKDAE